MEGRERNTKRSKWASKQKLDRDVPLIVSNYSTTELVKIMPFNLCVRSV